MQLLKITGPKCTNNPLLDSCVRYSNDKGIQFPEPKLFVHILYLLYSDVFELSYADKIKIYSSLMNVKDVLGYERVMTCLQKPILDFDVKHFVVSDGAWNWTWHVFMTTHHVGQWRKNLGKKYLQWGSEYQTFWGSNFKCFGNQTVGLLVMSYVLIQILDQYIRKQDGVHLSGIQMVELSSIQMALKNRTFGIQHLFDYLNTRLDQISDSHCI